ncbi:MULTISPECIES: PBSX family phage terminase large subunit [unclassified Sphingomonas]|uniref:PBSX family phage terminase large subunit n=1 Tax=unclassified Sphingomonas TaxID=196159 RepID=UPI0006F25AAA|nr:MULTISPECIES: PBSX family phage terminase large subunit [unclassified Sphingomonas]KQX18404.1 terminase [Sphingomonas sp. Root1294]KQY72271.1 terminase [Sphingomonas sp. Root50]KRB94458.1 terminase [Sphingomonas sp. Root720]
MATEAIAGIGHNGGPTLNPILQDFWLTPVNDNQEPVRNRVLYGGRASSKSWDAAGFAVFLACNVKIKVLCARQFQNKIEESVYSLLVTQIERFGLRRQFRILDNKIIHKRTGSEFIFYGLWRHISEIKSLEGIDICWLEEAHALTEEQWKVLEPTIRKQGSQFWIIFNPILSTDFAWRRFVLNPPPGTLARQINYLENPFLSDTMLRVIEAAWEEDEAEYQHIYLGIPRDDDDSVVIKRSWVMAAIDAHIGLGIDPSGSRRVGFDVADSGADKNALVAATGSLATWTDMWKAGEDELLKSATRARDAAVQREAELVYDSIGVGAGVGAKVNELNEDGIHIRHIGFNAGGAVANPDAIYARSHPAKTNKDMFANAKAQAWWNIADRFRNTFNAVERGVEFDPADLIFISSEIDNLALLIDELCTPKRDFDNAGKVKVESKKDLARANRKGGAKPSPNLADAFVMAMGTVSRKLTAFDVL